MHFLLSRFSRPISFVLIFFLLILSHGSTTAADYETTYIGAIVDVGSRAGKEQEAAMAIAVRNLSSTSEKHKFTMHIKKTSGEPLQAAAAAEQLIKENQTKVIIGMQTWQEAALVADIAQQAHVPVISFAATTVAPPLMQLRWPFLIQMATKTLEEMNCIASIVQSYNWRKVIAIYEDDMYGGEYGALALLSEALQSVGSEIEHQLVLPKLSHLSDSKGIIHEEVANVLLSKQSRVFIVLKSSLPVVTDVFKEAKLMGLMGSDSVWIITESVSNLLEYSADTTVISSIQGAIGIKTYYSEENNSFSDFKAQFRQVFRSDYPDEDNLNPGIHALRAYDSITTIAKSVIEMSSSSSSSNSNSTDFSKMLLKQILSSNFTGLSGDISFRGGMLSNYPAFRIINFVGKSYKELGFWSSKLGFSKSSSLEGKNVNDVINSMKMLSGVVNWPGDLDRVPKGWAMPSDAKKMKIGVPGRTSFEKFVKVEQIKNSDKMDYTGFCIDVFKAVVKILEQNYSLPYEFEAYNGTYDDLIDHVFNKTYDAVVGDVTVLANRSKYVEFTQPYAESGLSMLVPVKPESHKAWMFLKPFTMEMWVVTFGIMFYTMFIVWFMEHQSNPDFRGPWKDQLGAALWFTFSSLFFAHREKIHSNYTRVVVVVWLFVVLVLTSSYTASLSSMLTVTRLEPRVKSIDWIKKTNATIGCDPDSFVKKYLQTVLKLENIKDIKKQEDYADQLKSGNITAAFLELPYEKVFLNEYCNGYTSIGNTYRFGGFGFVFQKGSPIAADVSEAILTLSEKGELQRLESQWFNSARDCSKSNTTTKTENLSLKSFCGIYMISGAVSTFCFLIFLIRLMLQQHHIEEGNGNRWSKTRPNVGVKSLRRAATFSHTPNADEWSSSRWELVSPSETNEHLGASPQASPQLEIEIPIRTNYEK